MPSLSSIPRYLHVFPCSSSCISLLTSITKFCEWTSLPLLSAILAHFSSPNSIWISSLKVWTVCICFWSPFSVLAISYYYHYSMSVVYPFHYTFCIIIWQHCYKLSQYGSVHPSSCHFLPPLSTCLSDTLSLCASVTASYQHTRQYERLQKIVVSLLSLVYRSFIFRFLRIS